MISPREYQIECIESILERKSKGIGQQLVCLPTGTGKTVVFSLLAKQLNCKTLVVAHRDELLVQAKDKLQMVWPEANVGICKAKINEIESQIVIASIQTICRDKRLKQLKEQDFQLLIIDEAHHSGADSYNKVVKELGFLENNTNKLLVGVTATAKRADGIGLGTVFKELVYDRSIGTMVRAGYLAPLIGKQIYTRANLEDVGSQNGDFIQSELSKAINIDSRNQLIVSSYKEYAQDRKKCIVFCADVRHAQDLSALFKAATIPSASVYGAMEPFERQQVLKEFSSGKIQVLANCQVLTEGYDEPSVDCIVMARPTKSSVLYTQMIGRGTRTFPGKENCLVLDFCDNASRHDLCSFKNTLEGVVMPVGGDEEEIIEDKPKKGNIPYVAVYDPDYYLDRVENIKFFDNAHFAWNQVGDSWHLKLSANRDVWIRKVEGGYLIVAQSDGEVFSLTNRPLPLDYSLGLSEDWARKQTTKSAWARKDAVWRTEQASERQLDALSKNGISFDHGITKGKAAELLDSIFHEPATDKQMYFLKVNRIHFEEGITKVEASKLIAKQKKFA